MTFEEFLRTDLDPLCRYARVLTGSHDAAHDLVTDTLLGVQQRWHDIGKMEYPGAYVRRTLSGRFLSGRRHWYSRFVRATEPGQLPERPDRDLGQRIDDRDEIGGLLAGLPPQQRAAIVLRYYLDVPDNVIAKELGVSEGAVRTYISRGLAALRVVVTEKSTLT